MPMYLGRVAVVTCSSDRYGKHHSEVKGREAQEALGNYLRQCVCIENFRLEQTVVIWLAIESLLTSRIYGE